MQSKNSNNEIIKIPLRNEIGVKPNTLTSQNSTGKIQLNENFLSKNSNDKIKLTSDDRPELKPTISNGSNGASKKVLTIPLKTKESFDPKKEILTIPLKSKDSFDPKKIENINKMSPKNINLKDLKPSALGLNNISPRGFNVQPQSKTNISPRGIESIKLSNKLITTSNTSKSPSASSSSKPLNTDGNINGKTVSKLITKK